MLTTLVAIWMESPLLVSAPAVGILFPQLLWVIDFSLAALGLPASGTTAYMFSPHIPLFTRGLSFFHAWLPFALAWLVWRLGYDKRALPLWTLSAWVLLLISYFLMPAPPAPLGNPNLPVNINFAYGIGDTAAQTWMHPLAWLTMLFVVFPLAVFYPTHLFFERFAPKASTEREISVPGLSCAELASHSEGAQQ